MTFESSLLGYADEVAEERIAAADVIMIRGTETTSAVCDSHLFRFHDQLQQLVFRGLC